MQDSVAATKPTIQSEVIVDPKQEQSSVEIDSRASEGIVLSEEKDGTAKKPRGFFNTAVEKVGKALNAAWDELKKIPVIGVIFQAIEVIFKALEVFLDLFSAGVNYLSNKINGKGKEGKEGKEEIDEQGQEVAPEDKRPFTKSVDKFFDKFFGKKSEENNVEADAEHSPATEIQDNKEKIGISPSGIFNFLTKLLGDEAVMKQLSEIDGVGNLLDEMIGVETGEEFLKALRIITEIPEVQNIISAAGEEFGIEGADVTNAIDSTIKDQEALSAVDTAFLEHKPVSLDAVGLEVDEVGVETELEEEPVIEGDNMDAALAEASKDGAITGGLGEVELSEGEVEGSATDGVSAEIKEQRAAGATRD